MVDRQDTSREIAKWEERCMYQNDDGDNNADDKIMEEDEVRRYVESCDFSFPR